MDVPEDMICPLTKKIFQDPVMTPSGNTYEKAALYAYLENNNNLDPLTGEYVDLQQIRPNKVVKNLLKRITQIRY